MLIKKKIIHLDTSCTCIHSNIVVYKKLCNVDIFQKDYKCDFINVKSIYICITLSNITSSSIMNISICTLVYQY